MYMYLLSGIDSIMTPEEKTKLFTAIGYSESSHNLALPKHVSEKHTFISNKNPTISIRIHVFLIEGERFPYTHFAVRLIW